MEKLKREKGEGTSGVGEAILHSRGSKGARRACRVKLERDRPICMAN